MVYLKVTKPFTFDREYVVGEVIDIADLRHFPKQMLTNRIMNGFLEYQQEPVLSALQAGEEAVEEPAGGRSFRLPDEPAAS